MKVILKTDVKGMGKKGDTLEVSDGYARNFLLPRNIAVEASASALRSLQEEQDAKVRKQERITQGIKSLRDQLNDQTIRIKTRCGENGRLFGSITNKDVAEAIGKMLGKEFDRKLIELESPIKSLGTYAITLKFGQGIAGVVNVEIVEG